jgi:hypothetical protein
MTDNKKNNEEIEVNNDGSNALATNKTLLDIYGDSVTGRSILKDETRDYNPSGEVARRIAEKLKQRKQKLAELNEGQKKIDILSRYVSILSVGEHKDMNSLLNLSVYQLFDEFERFKLKMNYDIYLQAKMAGAKDLKEVED